ncbi:hypothetical protein K470DRAFT_257689 [Piedraia hortae CBS 480.64]|uniref:BHLH domain-containing protein n=1 Tax=Piedraia hortae CBS 480.64 TaxID=1314780 RepID=A0A6A7C0Z6_9PEZI|nr:hypothetical protein K470DRAFT_257689 [Piedraia hortae CBS 480.64]
MASPDLSSPTRASQLPSISAITSNFPGVTNGPPTSASASNFFRPSPDGASTADSARDSGHWPGQGANPQSLQVRTLLNPDDSPPRNSTSVGPDTPLSARAQSKLPAFSHSLYVDVNGAASNRTSRDVAFDSRRSSIDSRVHNLSSLNIHTPTSPYDSANPSQISLAASQRRPVPMSPASCRSSLRAAHPPRVAPPILPVGRSAGGPDPTAPRPTQGYPWAFPDGPLGPDDGPSRRSASYDSTTSLQPSRHNSLAASSVRSSILSAHAQLPPGQRHLDDAPVTTHHHTLQHPSIQALHHDSMSSVGGNYSRTPELRISHKLAERKRRSEMKDLFEELNRAVPSSGGAKASKWEILTKAIDHIKNSQHSDRHLAHEVQRLQRENTFLRDAQKEIELLQTELGVTYQHLRRLDPGSPHVYGPYTSQLSQQSSQANGGAISLPPLNSSAMQGVEYNGFSK